jgi:hypothetical protein
MLKLLKFKDFINYINESVLNEGGAYGHLNHPFDDIDLTFKDLEEMLSSTINGAFGPENFVQEKCLSPDSVVKLENLGNKTIKEVVDNKIQDRILSFNEVTNSIEYEEILNWVKNENSSEWIEIELEDGKIITVTPNHRIYVLESGDVKAENLSIGDKLIVFS